MRTPPRSTVQQYEGESRPCRRCGYDLKGLRVPGVCPECGTPIRRGRRFESSYTDTPLSTLRALGLWATLLAWGATGLCVGTMWFLWFHLSGRDAMWPALGMVLGWTAMGVAASVLCSPLATASDQTVPEPQRRRKGLRLALLGSLALAAGAVLCAWLANASTAAANLAGGYPAGYWIPSASAEGELAIGVCLGLACWVVGGSLFAAYLGSFSGWYDDVDLEERFRVVPFTLPFVLLPLLWLVFIPARGVLTLPAWWIMLGLQGLGLWFVLRPLFRFAATARWAARSVDLSHGKDARVSKRVMDRIAGNRARGKNPEPRAEEAIPLVEGPGAPGATTRSTPSDSARMPPVARRASERPTEVPRTGPPLL